MRAVTFRDKTYHICGEGFLADPEEWDPDFAEGMAAKTGIHGGLTEEHWTVIRYIRQTFQRRGTCPLVYETCHVNGLYLRDLQLLFPSGYQRGACRLAGITYREGYLERPSHRRANGRRQTGTPEKTYGVDVRGFLADPAEWDEEFAAGKAQEMKLPGSLTDRHWQIIRFLRDSYGVKGAVPTVYETCQANAIGIEELERLFPDGYHRGVVKIAGLRV